MKLAYIYIVIPLLFAIVFVGEWITIEKYHEAISDSQQELMALEQRISNLSVIRSKLSRYDFAMFQQSTGVARKKEIAVEQQLYDHLVAAATNAGLVILSTKVLSAEKISGGISFRYEFNFLGPYYSYATFFTTLAESSGLSQVESFDLLYDQSETVRGAITIGMQKINRDALVNE